MNHTGKSGTRKEDTEASGAGRGHTASTLEASFGHVRGIAVSVLGALSRISDFGFRIPSPRFLPALLAVFLAVTACVAAGAPPATQPATRPTVIADFDGSVPEGMTALGATAEMVLDPNLSAGGTGCLRLTLNPKSRGKAFLRLPLPQGVDPARHSALSAQVRVTDTLGSADLRWYALNADRKRLFQRRFVARESSRWKELHWPLAQWRWADEAVGDWSEVRWLVLVVESRAKEVWLDQVRMTPGDRGDASASPDEGWLMGLAFGHQEAASASADGVRVVTDAADKLSQADLKQLAERIRRVRAWIDRLMGDATRPVGKGSPLTFLILKDQLGYIRFFRRLGEAWDEEVSLPDAGGYTIQDVAASTYSAEYGIRRPVYLHEAVHAILARDVRLVTGEVRSSWFHEAMANYVQFCAYPNSIDRKAYVGNFAVPVDARGGSFFKPFKTLLSVEVRPENYAQLASVAAYLVAEHPDWLGKIARALADGADAEKALKDCGAGVEEFQKAWLDWGARTFSAQTKAPEDGSIFPVPKGLDIEPSTRPTSGPKSPLRK